MGQNARRGQRTTSLSTSDEGIVMDYGDELQRKRRVSPNFILMNLNFESSHKNGHKELLIDCRCCYEKKKPHFA